MVNIGVMVSGNGTNLQAIIDSIDNEIIKNGKIVIVISNKKDAYGLERAKKHNIPAYAVQRKNYKSVEEYDDAIVKLLKENKVDLVVLAGYLSILGPKFVSEYSNKIINIHPALIPSFCGKGYYGLHVHEKVLERGVKITGATVHFINEGVDEGPIIMQKAVPVLINDTPEILQIRVMKEAEHIILPQAIALFCENKLVIENGKVRIL